MAKRQYSFDEEKIQKFVKERRGQGHGSNYRPWLTVQDVSSLGRSTRIHSTKTQREHHLLSDLETFMFLIVEWSERVTDIREQFPLNRDDTRRIALEMGVQHPIDPHSRCDIVMTTDFLLDISTPEGTIEVARSVKPTCELGKKRILEKQEIEHRYWNAKHVAWGIVTEQDLPRHRVENLRWLHEFQSLEGLVTPYSGYWNDRTEQFLACLSGATGISIQQFFQHLVSNYGFATGEGLTVLRYLASKKIISFSLSEKFEVSFPIDAITISAVEP
jgi:hypothetical protein